MPAREIRIRVAVCLVEGERILLVQHVKNGRRYWLLPRGGVQGGEALAGPPGRRGRAGGGAGAGGSPPPPGGGRGGGAGAAPPARAPPAPPRPRHTSAGGERGAQEAVAWAG